MISYTYSTQIFPPAPFVLLTLRNPVTGDVLSGVPAQIDSAADRTVLPSSIAEAMDLEPLGNVQIGGFGGTITAMPTYAVLLGVHTLPERLIEVIAHAEESWVLLGRDVLNGLRIVLDGPRSVLEIEEQNP